jgi:putative peptidoglycan lipid II flippase
MTATDTKEKRDSRIARSTLIVMFAFGLAKVVSLLQTFIIAQTFGVSRDLDTYVAADSVSGIIFTLISGGALTYAFIPIFSGFLVRDSKEEAWRLASNILNVVFLFSLVISVIIFIFAVPIASVVAPGFEPAAQEQTANLLRILLLSTIILSISGIITGILQSHNHFLAPALAPVMLDLGILFGVVFLIKPLGIYGIAWGTVLGMMLHLAVQLPTLIRLRPRWYPSLGLNSSTLWRVFRLMLPRIAGLGLFLVNFQIAINIASRMSEGAVSAFSWGWRLMQIPETLIGTAMGTVIFPTLAALSELKDENGKRDAMSGALRFILIAAIPSAIGLVLVGHTGLSLLEGRAFDSAATELVYSTLRFFSLGLVVHSVLEVVARSFYADKDTYTPLWAALAGAAVNLTLSLLLTGMSVGDFLSNTGTLDSANVGYLALANSAGFGFEVLLLLWLLHRRWNGIGANALARTSVKTLVASLIMALALLLLDAGWRAVGLSGRGMALTVVELALQVGIGGVVFVAAAWILKIDEVKTVINILRDRAKGLLARRKPTSEAV